MPTRRNTDSPEEVAGQRLALAVETLSNIHYLIDQSCNDPDSVKKFVEMAGPAMEMLRESAREGQSRPQVLSMNSERSQASLPTVFVPSQAQGSTRK